MIQRVHCPGAALPLLRVFLCGRQWQRLWKVEWQTVGGDPPVRLCYDIEGDVRERVTEEVAPGIVAMWSDPRERLGL